MKASPRSLSPKQAAILATCGSWRSMGAARSFRFDARASDDRCPAVGFGLDVGGETVRRRSVDRHQRDAREPFARRAIGEQLPDLSHQFIDDRARRARRRNDALPGDKIEAGKSALGERRNVGRRSPAAAWSRRAP
jgi:hypothetical protein